MIEHKKEFEIEVNPELYKYMTDAGAEEVVFMVRKLSDEEISMLAVDNKEFENKDVVNIAACSFYYKNTRYGSFCEINELYTDDEFVLNKVIEQFVRQAVEKINYLKGEVK